MTTTVVVDQKQQTQIKPNVTTTSPEDNLIHQTLTQQFEMIEQPKQEVAVQPVGDQQTQQTQQRSFKLIDAYRNNRPEKQPLNPLLPIPLNQIQHMTPEPILMNIPQGAEIDKWKQLNIPTNLPIPLPQLEQNPNFFRRTLTKAKSFTSSAWKKIGEFRKRNPALFWIALIIIMTILFPLISPMLAPLLGGLAGVPLIGV